MPAFLTNLPVWAWLVWVVLIFLTTIVIARSAKLSKKV